MTDKTVKQVADMLGVTKQTIQYHLKSLPVNYMEKNDRNIIYIKPLGQKVLSSKISNKKNKSVGKETSSNDRETTKETVDKTEIEYLKTLIKEKDQQISQLLESQKQSQRLIENQQVLTLQANQKIEKLELDLEDDNDELNSFSVNKKKKWTDIFKSKK
ncbi:MAG: DUF536 domain-containing protein [Carnobacterium sp.]|nr:DUF536 domain-containing protein [Carnobacterium sp.]